MVMYGAQHIKFSACLPHVNSPCTATAMKWSLVLVAVSLLAIASAQTGKQCAPEISDKCPPPGVGTEPVFFDVPEHCSQYCECSNGLAWLFNCPPGTLWDSVLQECLAEYDVDCGSRPNP